MSENKEVRQTNSGVEKEGDWEEITQFAKDVEKAIEKSEIQEKSVEKYKEWRPREDEDTEQVKRKTVKQASMNKKKPEKESNGSKDLLDASKKIAKAGKKVGKRKKPNNEIKDASKEVTNFFMSKTLSSMRKFEETVYSDMMLRLNPYFFDTEDFSVDMRSKRNGEYKLELNIPDEQCRTDVKNSFREDN